MIGSASDSDRNGALDGSVPARAHVMAARNGLARTAGINFDQAARRYLWCKRQPGQIRESQSQNTRSDCLRRGHLAERWNTASSWRRAAFSRSRTERGMKSERSSSIRASLRSRRPFYAQTGATTAQRQVVLVQPVRGSREAQECGGTSALARRRPFSGHARRPAINEHRLMDGARVLSDAG